VPPLLIFTVSAAVTIAWTASMSRMGEMPMPGGWGMSMAWMRMCGQTWTEAFAVFIGMWTVMMVAMMLPSLVATLRYRRYADAGDACHRGRRVFRRVDRDRSGGLSGGCRGGGA
jgi:predicted metal-binding membrane protein